MATKNKLKGGVYEMNNKVIITGILAVAIVLIVGFLVFSGDTVKATVSAIGESRVQIEPDMAKVYLNLEARDNSSKIAKDKLDVISEKVMFELIRIGLDRDDIKTQSLNMYQEYDWSDGKQTPKGFVASQGLIIETNDFDKVADIVDASINGGALISWINFELSEDAQKEAKANALGMASADAKKKAESTASGLGKGIGKLVSVKSDEFNYGPYVYYAKEGGSADASVREAALSITPADVEVSARVSVEYELR